MGGKFEDIMVKSVEKDVSAIEMISVEISLVISVETTFVVKKEEKKFNCVLVGMFDVFVFLLVLLVFGLFGLICR